MTCRSFPGSLPSPPFQSRRTNKQSSILLQKAHHLWRENFQFIQDHFLPLCGTLNRESLFSSNREKAYHSSNRQHSLENSLNGDSYSQNSLENVFNPPHYTRNHLHTRHTMFSIQVFLLNNLHLQLQTLQSKKRFPKRKAQAVFRKVKSEFSQSSPAAISNNKATKATESSLANSSPNPHSMRYQRDLASVLDESESELFSTPDFSSNSTAGDQIVHDSFEDPVSSVPILCP